MAKSKKESSPSEPDPPLLTGEDNHAHVRYAIQKGTLFVMHRFAGHGPFKNARIWARRADAERYATKGEEVIPVTCAVGAPWSVLTQ